MNPCTGSSRYRYDTCRCTRQPATNGLCYFCFDYDLIWLSGHNELSILFIDNYSMILVDIFLIMLRIKKKHLHLIPHLIDYVAFMLLG